jgi:hypothetical protein
MAETQKSFPNIPVTSWINLRIQFKKTIPGNTTSNYLASVLSISEASAKTNIVPTLKLIGMIDEEGKTNQDVAKRFRDDSQYPKLCEDIIKKLYPQELLDAFPDLDTEKSKLVSWFMNHTGIGEAGAGRMVAFYSTLREANPSITKVTTPAKPKEAKEKQTKPVTKGPASLPKKDLTSPVNPNTTTSQRNFSPSLNINLQIHISSDATPEQIKSIFENMAKYIFKE